MKKNYLLVSLGTAALLGAIAIPLFAGPFGGRMGKSPMRSEQRMERHFKQMATELKLSAEQQAKMTSARDAFRAAQIELRAGLARQELEIEKGMREDSKISEQQMASLFEQRASIQAKLAMERYRLRTALRATLSDEQREKMAAMRSDRMEKFRSHRDVRSRMIPGMPAEPGRDRRRI